jgi:hypothetical protein
LCQIAKIVGEKRSRNIFKDCKENRDAEICSRIVGKTDEEIVPKIVGKNRWRNIFQKL